MAFKKSISSILGKKGSLHKALGVPDGKKISPAKLAAAAKKGGATGKKAQLVLSLERRNTGKKRK